MADDDMDLDGLDDFGSDDFGDQLDDFMDGDLGDGDSVDGDSELDSFFEDLSTIDDLEVKDEAPAEEPEEEPELEEEAPLEEPEEEQEDEEPEDKKPILIPAIIAAVIGALLGGIGLGIMWYINKPEDKPEEPITTTTTTQPLITAAPQVIFVPQVPAPTIPEAPPVIPPKPMQHFVQVANCIYKECIDDFRFLLKRHGYQAAVVVQEEKTPMTEVVSRQVLGEEDVSKWIERINQENQLPGEAYRKGAGTLYRVSLGLFPDLDTATRVKVYLNQLYNKQLIFEANREEQVIRYSKIRTGGLESREEAVQLQKILTSKDERFRGAFVVSVKE